MFRTCDAESHTAPLSSCAQADVAAAAATARVVSGDQQRLQCKRWAGERDGEALRPAPQPDLHENGRGLDSARVFLQFACGRLGRVGHLISGCVH